MKINSIHFENFRNLAHAELQPCEGVNILYGDNAQGKTNIVEGIWLMSGERSFRFGRESDLPRLGMDRDTQPSYIRCVVDTEGRAQEIDYRLSPKKQILVNGIALPSQNALAGKLHCVVFSPVHLALIKDGPQRRREFIDTTICQLKPRFTKVLADYSRALTQRSSLLREIPRNPYLRDTLDVWDSHIVRLGRVIIATRHSYTKQLAAHAAQFHSGISHGEEQLTVRYQCVGMEIPPDAREDLDALGQLLEQRLLQGREEDIRTGSTGVGPHRDDIEIEIDGVSARSFGSQGQQRSAVLALKLAECEMMAQTGGEQPIVLLDDVMSELDIHRRAYLLGRMEGRQIFITGCDCSLLAEKTGGRSFYIAGGTITPDPEEA